MEKVVCATGRRKMRKRGRAATLDNFPIGFFFFGHKFVHKAFAFFFNIALLRLFDFFFLLCRRGNSGRREKKMLPSGKRLVLN